MVIRNSGVGNHFTTNSSICLDDAIGNILSGPSGYIGDHKAPVIQGRNRWGNLIDIVICGSNSELAAYCCARSVVNLPVDTIIGCGLPALARRLPDGNKIAIAQCRYGWT